MENLESRQLLSGHHPGLHLVDPGQSVGQQLVYLDFNGAKHLTYKGPVTIGRINVPQYRAPSKLPARTSSVISAVVQQVQQAFEGSGIKFVTSAPRHGRTFSTVFIGGSGSEFGKYGTLLGVAEQVDVGNRNHADNAFVFADNLDASDADVTSYITALSGVVSHELAHLVGYAHDAATNTEGVLAQVSEAVHGKVNNDIPLRLPFDNGTSYAMNNGYGDVGDSDHHGFAIDFAMPQGTRVLAASGGTVVKVHRFSDNCPHGRYVHGPNAGKLLSADDAGGNFVKIQHQGSDGTVYYSYYMHLDSVTVRENDIVQAGDLVGYSGESGYATGYHLHFQVKTASGGVRPVPMAGVDLTSNDGSATINDFETGDIYEAIDPTSYYGPGQPIGGTPEPSAPSPAAPSNLSSTYIQPGAVLLDWKDTWGGETDLAFQYLDYFSNWQTFGHAAPGTNNTFLIASHGYTYDIRIVAVGNNSFLASDPIAITF